MQDNLYSMGGSDYVFNKRSRKFDTSTFLRTPPRQCNRRRLFTEDVVKGNPPHETWSKRMHAGVKYYSEKIMFGIPTGQTLSQGARELAERHGLRLSKFENIGDVNDKKKVPWYVFTEMTKT